MTLTPNLSIQKIEPSANPPSLKDDMNLSIQLDNRGTIISSFRLKDYKPSPVITREVLSQLLQSSLNSVNLGI
jgi:hypothetical protein